MPLIAAAGGAIVKNRLLRSALFVALVTGIGLVTSYRDQIADPEALTQWFAQYGKVGPILFIAVYAVGTVLFFPGSVLTIAGGAIFGPIWGTFYNLTGATLGATLAFLIARYLAADAVQQKAAGRLKQLKQGVEHEGWRFIAFARLVPLFPFNLLNYALGLTRIKLSHYIIASCLCMLPGGFAYTWLGYAGREAVSGNEGLIRNGILALALLASVAFIPRLVARLRHGPTQSAGELKQALDNRLELLLLDVRTAGDFAGVQGHIARARNIPLEKLPVRLDELSGYITKPIWLVCRDGRRSARAARTLLQNGFTNVHVIRGGMAAWIKQGYKTER